MAKEHILQLVPVIFGGVIAAFLVSWLTSRRDFKDYKRRKIEELYEVVRQDSIEYFDWYIRYYALFEGSITLNEFSNNQKFVSLGAERKTKAEMLSSLYIKNISGEIEDYWASKKTFTLTINRMYQEMQRIPNLPEMAEFDQNRLNVESAKSSVLEKLANLSSKL